MLTYSKIALAIVLLHGIWGLAYVAGAAVLSKIPARKSPSGLSGQALSEIVVFSITGLAGFAALGFIAGLLHLLYWETVVIAFVVVATICFLGKNALLEPQFWRNRLQTIKNASTPAALFAYVSAIALGIQASFPDTSFDAQSFHLAYPYEWATAHALTVDMSLRNPFYSMNWPLLYSWFYSFALGDFTSILSWLSTILGAIGIQAIPRIIVREANPSIIPAVLTEAILALASLTYLLSPTLLRWEWTSLIDVPIGTVMLSALISAINSLSAQQERRYFTSFIISFAFLIGMKTSFFLLVPLGFLVLFALARFHELPMRTSVLAFCAFSVLVSPWYIRNFVLDGDPIAPILNLELAGKDAKWSKADLAGQIADVSGAKNPRTLAGLPFQITFHTETQIFREYGVTLSYLGLYLPMAVLLAYFLFSRRSWDTRIVMCAMILSYLVSYWIGTSYLARYSLLFAAGLSSFLALIVLTVFRSRSAMLCIGLPLMSLASMPSPSSLHWFKEEAQIYLFPASYYVSESTFLASRLDGWNEAQQLAHILAVDRHPHRVYLFLSNVLKLTFLKDGIPTVGDWYGSGRYMDLYDAVYSEQLEKFVRQEHVDAFFIPDEPASPLPPHAVRKLEAQASRLGFTRISAPGAHYITLAERPLNS